MGGAGTDKHRGSERVQPDGSVQTLRLPRWHKDTGKREFPSAFRC